MGYERYPRTSGGYDDRDQRQGYGRDTNDRDAYGVNRDSYDGNRDTQPWGSYDEFAQRDRYGDAGERQSRYRRDAGVPGQGQGQGQGQGIRQAAYGSGNYGQGASQTDRYGARDNGRPDTDRSGNRDRFQAEAGRQPRGQDYGRQPQGYDYDERGFLDRAGDEVRSWFGDDDANRRRDLDARGDEQRYGPSGSDDHYHTWRRTQIAALDRDYDEYRQENRSKFESEFGSWRNQRQTQRGSLSKVTEHMDVVGSDGAHVGTVDKVRGDRILLTKSDADAGGRHHSIPSRWIQSVDDKVTISKTAEEAHALWRDEERNQAFFNEDGTHTDTQGDDQNPRVLGRSFSGTY